MPPTLNYSFGYLFVPNKPLDHVLVKYTQLIVWANASTEVEHVIQAKSAVIHLFEYY